MESSGPAGRSNKWQAIAAVLAALAAVATATVGVFAYVDGRPSSPTSFEGTWRATENDRPGGSSLALTISKDGDSYDITLDDDFAGGEWCHGQKVRLSGHGRKSGDMLAVAYTFPCPTESTRSVEASYRHRSDSDTLVDNDNLVWERD
ncbi:MULTISPECIES: hypothetical protein [Nonomuraea]|uniref:Uncharacterized protein n=1 Tax=Nonomuraea mangrovi TaxID=2316207 RepID=A0ABW4T261_9ACTN